MDGLTDGQIDRQMDGQREFLPVLLDFVPYWAHSPASKMKIYANKEKQVKGIADHLMLLGRHGRRGEVIAVKNYTCIHDGFTALFVKKATLEDESHLPNHI